MRLIVVFVGLAAISAAVAYYAYRRILRRAKGIERGLKMVPVLIHLPPRSSDAAQGGDQKASMQEQIAQAEVLYNILAGTAQRGFKSNFYGQRHVGLEIIASAGNIKFYAAVPVALVPVVEKAIASAYPGARLEQTEDHNLFNPDGKLDGVAGGELELKRDKAYPIRTYKNIERDPLEAILNTLSDLKAGDGVGIQILLRPAAPTWTKSAERLADDIRHNRKTSLKFTAKDFLHAAVKAPKSSGETGPADPQASSLELAVAEGIENKIRQPAYESLIRILVSSDVSASAPALLQNITASFALFDDPSSNGFQFVPARDKQGLVTAFIFRFFPPELNSLVLGSNELATIFHLPEARFTPTAEVQRESAKHADAPSNVATEGVLLGYNEYRGQKKEIKLAEDDRRRHVYIVGQTGTGKSTMLETIALQDMMAGRGFVFIDPHGDASERLLGLVPKDRAEDVIYFDPADTSNPLGLNLFEYQNPEQRDFIIQESINMLYRLYDPGHTGIIGPRYEHWFRNAALTLMSDPNGSTFVEVPKVFTDTEFLKAKFKYVKDPTVVDFWTKEMAQTSDFHKSEVLGWFVSKFGAFVNNEMMRNIIGQTKSSFNLREIMDKRQILLVNLSKGRVGELNSQLLGMILVTKIQAAAMSRAEIPEAERTDFSLIVDEFQNFSTDSFATILSEARKYRLNLIVANQFIGQLNDQVREAVFGNVGTMAAFRTGPDDAEYLVKQFAPIFERGDLSNLPNFYAVVKLMIAGLPSQPFSMLSLPPVGTASKEMSEAVKQLSAAKFGRPRDKVSTDIMTRMGSLPALKPKQPEPTQEAESLSLSSFKKPEEIVAAAQTSAPAPQPAPPPPQPEPALESTVEPTPASEPQQAPPAPGQVIEPAVEPAPPAPVQHMPVPTPAPPEHDLVSSSARPAPGAVVMPQPESQAVEVAPGEIAVDEHGNIIQG